jgi:hypothetical protein
LIDNAGLDLVTLSERDSQEQLSDTDSTSVAESSQDESAGASLLPHWMRVTVDEVVGSSLDGGAVLSSSLPGNDTPDQDVVSGSLCDSKQGAFKPVKKAAATKFFNLL